MKVANLIISPKIAIIHDILPFRGGAERTLEAMLEVLPGAAVYTLVYNRQGLDGSPIRTYPVHTSLVNRFPLAHKLYRNYLPILPLAVEQFDLSDFDIVISSSYAVAHGVLTRPGQLHVCVTYTPLRQAWNQYHEFIRRSGRINGVLSLPARVILHYLRLWDKAAADRVDHFIAISNWVARMIWRYYRRQSEVIYPPVDIQRFKPAIPRGDYYLAVSRLVTHKRVALIKEAFTRLKYPLIIVGDGPERRKVQRGKPENIRILGWQTEEILQRLMGNAKALVHAAEEDFGIVLVEAQASGCPVIAYGKGAASEIVIPGRTGILYNEPNVEGLIDAIERFEANKTSFLLDDLIENAGRFDRRYFKEKFSQTIEREWLNFTSRTAVDDQGGRWGLNPQPSDPQSDALPVELRPPLSKI